MTRRTRIARGFDFGSGTEFAAEVKPKAGTAFGVAETHEDKRDDAPFSESRKFGLSGLVSGTANMRSRHSISAIVCSVHWIIQENQGDSTAVRPLSPLTAEQSTANKFSVSTEGLGFSQRNLGCQSVGGSHPA
jgi:hypothetical protein